MKVTAVFLAFLLPAATCLAAPHLSDKTYAPILSFYRDCTWVATNAAPADIMRIAWQVRHGRPQQPAPLDFRGRKLLLAIQATADVVLDPDPGIFYMPRLMPEYAFRVTPLAIQKAGPDTVDIVVAREGVGKLFSPARPAGGPDLGPARWAGMTEIDHWVLVGGTWRLSALRWYLI